MNERIKLLAEQAFESVYAENGNMPMMLQKFAELIVRDCGQYLNSPEFIGRSDLDWSMVLNEHFGVK